MKIQKIKMPLDKILTQKEAKELIEKGEASTINYNGVADLLFVGKELYSKEKGSKNYQLVQKDWFSYLRTCKKVD